MNASYSRTFEIKKRDYSNDQGQLAMINTTYQILQGQIQKSS